MPAYHWQAVTVPAEPSLNMKAALVSPSCYDVLDSTGKNMTIVWQAGRKRRSVIKCIPNTPTSTVNHCWLDLDIYIQCTQWLAWNQNNIS